MNPTIRLLYAEDNLQDANLTCTHFAECAPEFEIEIVDTGQRCIERLGESEFDLLLLDHRLPDMDGLDVLKALLQNSIQVSVVLVTGVGDKELAEKALRLNVACYVPKQDNYLEALPNLLRGLVREQVRKGKPGLQAAATPQRILFIEQQPAEMEEILRHFAGAMPHLEIEAVNNCSEALTRLEQPQSYDLVLIDLSMPELGGLYFMHEAKIRCLTGAPFLVITSLCDETNTLTAFKLGAFDCIARHEGFLAQLPYAVEKAISCSRSAALNEQLQADLAKHQRVEGCLWESDRRLHSLCESISIGFYRSAPDGKVFFANPALIKILGCSSLEDLILKELEETGYEPNDQRRQFIEQIESSGKVHEVTSIWIRRDGTQQILREGVVAVHDFHGKIWYYEGIVEDITKL